MNDDLLKLRLLAERFYTVQYRKEQWSGNYLLTRDSGQYAALSNDR